MGTFRELDLQKVPFETVLPVHIALAVVTAIMPFAARVAVKGIGEGVKAHGFTIIFGVGTAMLARDEDGYPALGEANCANLFEGHHMTVFSFDERLVLSAIREDGALLIDSITGEFLCNSYLVCDLRKGERGKGARHRSASAVAKQADSCYVIKCSQEDCERGVARFDVFLGNDHETFDATHLVDGDLARRLTPHSP